MHETIILHLMLIGVVAILVITFVLFVCFLYMSCLILFIIIYKRCKLKSHRTYGELKEAESDTNQIEDNEIEEEYNEFEKNIENKDSIDDIVEKKPKLKRTLSDL